MTVSDHAMRLCFLLALLMVSAAAAQTAAPLWRAEPGPFGGEPARFLRTRNQAITQTVGAALWDVQRGVIIRRLPWTNESFVLTRNDSLAIILADSVLRILDVATWRVLDSIAIPPSRGWVKGRLALAPDDQTLVVTCRPSGLTLVSIPERRIIGRFGDESRCDGDVAISPDGTRLLVHSPYQPDVSELHDLPARTLIARFSDRVRAEAFDRTGEHVITLMWDGGAQLRRSSDGSFVRSMFDSTRRIGPPYALHPRRDLIVANREDLLGRRLGLEVCDLSTGETLATSTWDITGLAFSPDGSMLMATRPGMAPTMLDPTTLELDRMLGAHDGPVQGIAFSPDGRVVASVAGDASRPDDLLLWDAASGDALGTVRHGGVLTAVAFSIDGSVIATGSRNGELRLWSTATRTLLATIDAGDSTRGPIRFSRDGRLVAAIADTSIGVWRTDDWSPVARVSGTSAITAFDWGDYGATLVGAAHEASGSLGIWDAVSGSLRGAISLAGWRGGFRALVEASPDGRTLATAEDGGGEIHFIDLATGDSLPSISVHQSEVVSTAVSADDLLLATGDRRGRIAVWRRDGNELLGVLEGHADRVISLDFAHGGHALVSASRDGTARVWDCDSLRVTAVLDGHRDWVYRASFSTDDARVFTASGDGTVTAFNASTGARLATRDAHQGWALALAVSDDGSLIASGGADRVVRLWDATSLDVVGTLEGHADAVTALEFVRDSRTLVSASYRQMRRWDVQTRSCIDSPMVATDWINSIAVAPDGLGVVIAGREMMLRRWSFTLDSCLWIQEFAPGLFGALSMTSGGEAFYHPYHSYFIGRTTGDGRSIPGLSGLGGVHLSRLTSMAFSPDGRRLATASIDGTARVWDLERRSNIATWTQPVPTSIAYSPDGRSVVTGGIDGSITMWDASGLIGQAHRDDDAFASSARAHRDDDARASSAIVGASRLVTAREAIVASHGALEADALPDLKLGGAGVEWDMNAVFDRGRSSAWRFSWFSNARDSLYTHTVGVDAADSVELLTASREELQGPYFGAFSILDGWIDSDRADSLAKPIGGSPSRLMVLVAQRHLTENGAPVWYLRNDGGDCYVDALADSLLFCEYLATSPNASETGSGDFDVWPNPTSDVISVRFPVRSGDVRIALVDNLGRDIRSAVVSAAVGGLVIPVGDLSPGSYWLRFVQQGAVSVRRVVVAR